MKAFIHPSLNNNKGVVRTRELQGMDEAEIASELKQAGGQMIKAWTYVLSYRKKESK